MFRCPFRPHPPPLPLLPPRHPRSLLLPLPPCPVKCNGDALVARFSPHGYLVQKNKGESHKRRPSPCFDFADFFGLRRKNHSTASRFSFGFGLKRRGPLDRPWPAPRGFWLLPWR